MVFLPGPSAANYPTDQQLQLQLQSPTGDSTLVKCKCENGHRLMKTKYLGMMLHVTLSWSCHLREITIPTVRRRINTLRSDVANHGVLSPKSCMDLISIDVMSCIRYGIELWIVPRWLRSHCDYGRDLDELDELFIPTLRSILALGNECNYERVLDVAVYKELGWSGIDGVGLPALLRFLHNTLRMDAARTQSILLHRDLDNALSAGAIVPASLMALRQASPIAAVVASMYQLCFGAHAMHYLFAQRLPCTKHHVKKVLVPVVKNYVADYLQQPLFTDRPLHHASINYITSDGVAGMMHDLLAVKNCNRGKTHPALIDCCKVALWLCRYRPYDRQVLSTMGLTPSVLHMVPVRCLTQCCRDLRHHRPHSVLLHPP